MKYDVAIVGGGAAGFFTAIQIAEFRPEFKILILERGKEVLTKVRISGGGRCNVTHAEFDPSELIKNYPRGERELLGPFHNFNTADVIDFFEKRGVSLKTEEDGRMFPVTDSSETIINCFLSEAKKSKIEVLKNHAVKNIQNKEGSWFLETNSGNFKSENLVIATGSNPKIWKMLTHLGHEIVSPVPSLFTFNIKDNRIKDLAGISQNATVSVLGTKLMANGPLLITHWGMSGPAVLKLSAWGARILNEKKYHFKIAVNWLYDKNASEVQEMLNSYKISYAKKQIINTRPFSLSKRLWLKFTEFCKVTNTTRWADLSKKQIIEISHVLTASIFTVQGKSTFKEEFVTAGGVVLKEIDFKTFSSKKHKKLYFAGEVLNIDAITGGFNFQNAWTGAYIAAKAISNI